MFIIQQIGSQAPQNLINLRKDFLTVAGGAFLAWVAPRFIGVFTNKSLPISSRALSCLDWAYTGILVLMASDRLATKIFQLMGPQTGKPTPLAPPTPAVETTLVSEGDRAKWRQVCDELKSIPDNPVKKAWLYDPSALEQVHLYINVLERFLNGNSQVDWDFIDSLQIQEYEVTGGLPSHSNYYKEMGPATAFHLKDRGKAVQLMANIMNCKTTLNSQTNELEIFPNETRDNPHFIAPPARINSYFTLIEPGRGDDTGKIIIRHILATTDRYFENGCSKWTKLAVTPQQFVLFFNRNILKRTCKPTEQIDLTF